MFLLKRIFASSWYEKWFLHVPSCSASPKIYINVNSLTMTWWKQRASQHQLTPFLIPDTYCFADNKDLFFSLSEANLLKLLVVTPDLLPNHLKMSEHLSINNRWTITHKGVIIHFSYYLIHIIICGSWYDSSSILVNFNRSDSLVQNKSRASLAKTSTVLT